MKYDNLKIGELRKLIAEQFKLGSFEIQGHQPSSPSRFIHNLKKAECIDILENKVINFDIDVIWTAEPVTPEPVNAEPVNAEPVTAEPVTPSAMQNFSDNLLSAEYVTTKGVKDTQEVFSDLNLPAFNTAINQNMQDIADLNNIASKALKMAQSGSGSGGVTISIPNVPDVKLDGEHLHPKFEDILFHLTMDKNVYLYGASGAGKTTTAIQLSKALKLERFACYSCSSGMSESLLTGRLLPDVSNGTSKYLSTEFVNIYENGGLILLDEFDAIDGNCAVMLNSAMANDILHVPNRTEKPTAKRHPECYILSAGNTDGSGNGSRMYSGRNKLDGATLNRFTMITFGYDGKLERKLAQGNNELVTALNKLRANVDKFELPRVISSRDYLRCAKWMGAGKNLAYCLNAVTASWTEYDVKKVELSNILGGI